MIWVAVIFFISPVMANEVDATYDNNTAVEDLLVEDYESSKSGFLKAMQHPKTEQTARLNLGLTFELAKEKDRALNEYQAVAKAKNSTKEQRYYANYNAGRALQSMKRNDEALKHYQAALSLNPDSYEVKHNIELMTQQQQGGGGKGDPDSESKDDGKDKNKDPKGTDPEEQEKEARAKPKELDEKDVKKILEELKNQEQKIRAKEYGKDPQKTSSGKDW